MKKYLILTFACIVLVIFQTSFFAEILGYYFNPNLVMAFAFSLLLFGKTRYAMFSAFLSGLLIDAQGFSIIGLSSLLFTAFLAFSGFIRKYIINDLISNALVIAVCTVIYQFVFFAGQSVDIQAMLFGLIFTLVFVYIFSYLNKHIFYEKRVI